MPTAGDRSHILPDILAPGLRVVFCGTAAGTASARRGAYYAGPGNKFWPVLHRAGLTDRRLAPEEFARLVGYGIGLTDIAKTAHGADRSLRGRDYDAAALRAKIERFAPAFLAFNGKNAGSRLLGRPVAVGEQEETIGPTRLFVLPSTSGAANGHWDERHWTEFTELVLAGEPLRGR